MLMVIVIIVIFTVNPLFAYEEKVMCDKSAKASEYSWNPPNKFVTQRLQRFYALEDLIQEDYSSNHHDSAKALLSEYLELADVYRCNWNYGNAIHDANRFLGLMSIKNGKIDEATGYLLKAGKSAGSPQLDSFGPELDLANLLLKLGQQDEVVRYLKDIEAFWEMHDGRINRWIAEIERGGQPDLNRFSVSGKFSPLLISWLSALWPILIATLFLITQRKKIQKKWLFGIVGIVTGYITMYAVNWVSISLLPYIILKFVESGNDTMLIFSLSVVASAPFTIPFVVVYAVSRMFVTRYA